MADPLTTAISDLVRDAESAATDPRAAGYLATTRRRLDEPLRVAIAGKVKAGKSTLLNALLGEELAPTDAGECTKIVTWYRSGERPQVFLRPRRGPRQERPFNRSGGALDVHLGTFAPEDVGHLDIRWPSRTLRDLTIIDTPGIASLSTDVSARTYRALVPDDTGPAHADAVIYLLRHTHASDIRFLESFHDDELAHGTSLNAVGVLARADEIGSSRPDALDVAQRIGRRYQADPRLRPLCPIIVPVSALLSVAGQVLREAEFQAIATLAAEPASEVTRLLMTADRFARGPSSVRVTPLDREALLARLGLFGIRLAVELVRRGDASRLFALRMHLIHRSGLPNLRRVLRSQFADRAEILKARSALAALDQVLRFGHVADAGAFRARSEEIRAGAHKFVEIRVLNDLRSGALKVPKHQGALERVLGASGYGAATRLGLPLGSEPEELRLAATDALVRWRTLAAHPISPRPVKLAAGVAARAVEGILAELPGPS